MLGDDLRRRELQHALVEGDQRHAHVVVEADEEFSFPFVDLGERKGKDVRKVGVNFRVGELVSTTSEQRDTPKRSCRDQPGDKSSQTLLASRMAVSKTD